jgi:hypothetical protein
MKAECVVPVPESRGLTGTNHVQIKGVDWGLFPGSIDISVIKQIYTSVSDALIIGRRYGAGHLAFHRTMMNFPRAIAA